MVVDFKRYSSIKIGPKIELFNITKESYPEFDGVVVGGANNLLISPTPPPLGMLDKSFDFIKFDGEYLRVGGATKSAKLYNFAMKNDIFGFEFLKNIPGTIGGLLKMNAGLMGYEISNNLILVEFFDKEVAKDELKFGYRKSGIDEVVFTALFKVERGFDRLLANKIAQNRANQPRGASFGSIFKNPTPFFAGKLLEEVGLKGYKIGGCGFSDAHANFLINYGEATFDEALSLINLAKKRVFENFGVNLETEVVIL